MSQENGSKNGKITKNTSVTIGIVIAIVAGTITSVGGYYSLSSTQAQLEQQVSSIEGDYVPRNEISLQLDSIERRLERMEQRQEQFINSITSSQ